jgi:glutathione peroxidase
MKALILSALALFSMVSSAWAETCPGVLNYQAQKLRSSESIDFCAAFKGKVVLVVNTASNCGYTPQFQGLEALYQKYKDRGLAVVGFPSNDFFQEFENSEDTAKVCYLNYGVTFPMLNKSSVKGASANPLFQSLIQATGKPPKWNFHKYLIAKDGKSVTAYESNVRPEQLDATIQTLLAAP